MSELKRCPFCGDEVEIVPTGLYHWKYAIHHKSKTECILDANAFTLPYEEEDAVRMWNTRADRKTESSSEKPNNCEDLQDWKDQMWAEAVEQREHDMLYEPTYDLDDGSM